MLLVFGHQSNLDKFNLDFIIALIGIVHFNTDFNFYIELRNSLIFKISEILVFCVYEGRKCAKMFHPYTGVNRTYFFSSFSLVITIFNLLFNRLFLIRPSKCC